MNEKTRKLTLMAMLAALAYLIMLIGRIPVVLFLSYDPKDVVIAIAGFLLGPLSGATISLLVSLVEMVTVSDHRIHRLFHERAVHVRVHAARRLLLPPPPLHPRRGDRAGAGRGVHGGGDGGVELHHHAAVHGRDARGGRRAADPRVPAV